MTHDAIETTMSASKMVESFLINLSSDQPIEAIAERMPGACSQNNFALLYTYNYHEVVANKGYPIDRKVFIYEICQAKTAAKMLTYHPEFSAFMPCKISVYEKDGETILSTLNMDLLLKAVEDNPDLYEEATNLFSSLKKLMKSLTRE